MRLRIKVEQQHIDMGKPKSACGCPIALAIAEQMPKEWRTECDVVVRREEVLLYDTGDIVGWAEMPVEGMIFVSSFDRYEPVKPFEFDLEMKVEL